MMRAPPAFHSYLMVQYEQSLHLQMPAVAAYPPWDTDLEASAVALEFRVGVYLGAQHSR